MNTTPTRTRRAKLFISYSRRDTTFVDQLAAGLHDLGFDVFVDKKDIAAGEPWKERISSLIAVADTLVFVVSPNSVASPVCGWEIDESARLGKRILPVVSGRVPDSDAPPALARLNYIFALETDDDLTDALQRLDKALETDLSWVREHTRLTEIALHWTARGKPASLLLRGKEIDDAERWLSQRPSEASQPTEIHRDLIGDSRRAARNRQRASVVGALVVAAVALGLAAFAEVSRRRAEEALQAARGTANTLVTDLAADLRDKIGMPATLVRSILDPALALQERLVSSAGSDAELRADQSHALALMSTTLLRIGDTQGAVRTATRSRDIAEELLRREPTNPRLRSQFSEGLRAFGMAELKAGDVPGALAAFRQRLALAREDVAAGPNLAAARTQLDALTKLGELSSDIGDDHGSAAAIEEALGVARAAAASAGTPRDRHSLVEVLVHFSVVQIKRGDRHGALDTLREAFDLALKDGADDTDAAARAELARTLTAMAVSFRFLNDPAAEFASADEAVRIARELAWDKQNYETQDSLAQALYVAAGLKALGGRAEDSIREFEECIGIRRALARDGSHPAARITLADTLYTLAGTIAAIPGRTNDAIAELDEAVSLYRANAQSVPDPSASLLKPAETLLTKLRAEQKS